MSRYTEIVTGMERQAALLLLAVLLVGLSGEATSAQPLDAQTLCFDIVSPRDAARLDGSILLDRCTGQTWLLSRSGKRSGMVVYRWTMLAAEGDLIRKPLALPRAERARPSAAEYRQMLQFPGTTVLRVSLFDRRHILFLSSGSAGRRKGLPAENRHRRSVDG